LGQYDYAGAAMVTFAFREGDVSLPPSGTGVLVPLGAPFGEETVLITAVTFLDRKWPHLKREGDVVLRVHVGRADDDRFGSFSDEALTQRTLTELATLLGHAQAPFETRVQRWSPGLPQYYPGHEGRVAAAKAAAARHHLALCGSTYDGVGIPASVGSGRSAATAITALLA
jgi:oxygen-dependent protoporphyrinogen oxidase